MNPTKTLQPFPTLTQIYFQQQNKDFSVKTFCILLFLYHYSEFTLMNPESWESLIHDNLQSWFPKLLPYLINKSGGLLVFFLFKSLSRKFWALVSPLLTNESWPSTWWWARWRPGRCWGCPPPEDTPCSLAPRPAMDGKSEEHIRRLTNQKIVISLLTNQEYYEC